MGGQQLEESQLLPIDAFVGGREHPDPEAEKLEASLKALEKLEGLN